MDPGHLGVMFEEVVRCHGQRPATRIKGPQGWITRTYAEMGERVRGLAARLVMLGVEPGDRVVLFSGNRPEWSEVDFACLMVRAVPVPLYHTSTVEQIRHIVADSGATLAFVAGTVELDRIREAWPDLPGLRRVLTVDEVDDQGGADERVGSLADLLAQEATGADEVDRRLAEASADDLALLIYTSGTTGEPKGVMLTHRGFSFQVEALDKFFVIAPEDQSLCFLPLSHALERAWSYCVFAHGSLNTYVPDARTVAKMLVEARPTMFVSVPRLYEKVYLTAHERVSGSPTKKAIFSWAFRVGGRLQHAYRKGRRPSWIWRAQFPLADALVLKNIRAAMGGRKSVMACGGAPLRQEIEEFFSAAGMQLLSGYGLTEASPLVTFNAPDAFKLGTSGRVVVGGEIKIGGKGELLYRGPNVMKGYWNSPEATADSVDSEGWLHTGDVGYVDTDGYLVITDRIKDLIVTSNGKNIAPGRIEGLLLADPLFEHAILLGDNRPYLTLLVSPEREHLERLAKQLQVTWANRDELFTHPDIRAEVERRVRELTSRLAQHEQIRDLRLLIDEFTMDNGLLTPSLKVKRKEVERRFAQIIEEMYSRLQDRRGQDPNKD